MTYTLVLLFSMHVINSVHTSTLQVRGIPSLVDCQTAGKDLNRAGNRDEGASVVGWTCIPETRIDAIL